MTKSKSGKPGQIEKFVERRTTPEVNIKIGGKNFVAFKNVYDTSTDTRLMVEVVKISPKQTFVEIGCGAGAVSLLVGMKAKSGLGADINPAAVKNAKINKRRLGVKNVKFILSDAFDNIKEKFDVVICNPPYNPYKPSDVTEMMFWDDENKMKKKFFRQLKFHVKRGSDVYFGWAEFSDLDQNFPRNQAEKANLTFVRKYSRKRSDGFKFLVYKFKVPK